MMDYKNIVKLLFEMFPVMLEDFKDDIEEFQRLEEEYPDIESQSLYFDRCFCNFIGGTLIQDKPDKETRNKIFNFLEEMAESSDANITALLDVTVLEYIADWYIFRSRGVPLMGPETKRRFDEVKKGFREPPPEDFPDYEYLEKFRDSCSAFPEHMGRQPKPPKAQRRRRTAKQDIS